ncbi:MULTISPECIES: FABP family protein [unclassified Cryobacterium]|uniref:heme-binding beta-barrel domain-containing protein n=1 Tax=unclassified Cryobacterium TaxID=2649013 RepID=UPI00144882D7
MIELDANLPAELVPLSWLLGVWEGSGVVNFTTDDGIVNHEFGQRISFSHDGFPHLNYSSYAWLLESDPQQPLATETGYWRLSRPATSADPGPGMLAGVGEPSYGNADAVETLRNDDGGFDLEVSLLHPGGVSELYLGQVKGPRIDLATDAVMRSGTAKDHSASTRLYGLVEGHLLWAWDLAALGRELQSHASARLAKVE